MVSRDGTNRLTRARVHALTTAVEELATPRPSCLVITGNTHFFSAGADLNEIAVLSGPEAFRFAHGGFGTWAADVSRNPTDIHGILPRHDKGTVGALL